MYTVHVLSDITLYCKLGNISLFACVFAIVSNYTIYAPIIHYRVEPHPFWKPLTHFETPLVYLIML